MGKRVIKISERAYQQLVTFAQKEKRTLEELASSILVIAFGLKEEKK